MTGDGTRGLVLAFCRTFYNDKDYERAKTMLSPDLVNHHPSAAARPEATGRGFREQVGDRFPGFTLEVQHSVAEGDRVWTHSIVRLTPGGPPTASVVDMWRVADGLIVEHRDVAASLES